MNRPLRIVYAAGPGDVLATYRYWKNGLEYPDEVARTYSGQFYDVVRDLGARAYVISSSKIPGYLRDERFIIRHRSNPLQTASGALFHVGQIWAALRLMASALWFKADVVIMHGGTCHWFPLRVAPVFGVKVIPTLHNVIWPKDTPPSGVQKVVARLNRKFLSKTVSGVMSISHDVSRQVREASGGEVPPIMEFLPTYLAEQFVVAGRPPVDRPFRVLFAGRVESNKGVFQLFEVATRFASAGRNDIEFDICGIGGALEELEAAADVRGLSQRFRCHGHLDKSRMREMFAHCHVVVVPTTTEFTEGFNKVVAEGVLYGRPVITSSVCPALDYVREAVVEVPPDNTGAYGDAIIRLCDDDALYGVKSAACVGAKAQFYDANNGWAAALKRLLVQAGLVSRAINASDPSR